MRASSALCDTLTRRLLNVIKPPYVTLDICRKSEASHFATVPSYSFYRPFSLPYRWVLPSPAKIYHSMGSRSSTKK